MKIKVHIFNIFFLNQISTRHWLRFIYLFIFKIFPEIKKKLKKEISIKERKINQGMKTNRGEATR